MMTATILAIVLLQVGSQGIAGVKPVLLPDVSLLTLLALAALNPATIAVAWGLGRRADAPAKLLIAGFAAACAGALLLWLGTLFRFQFLATPARAAGGIFVAGIGFGMLYAGLAYRLVRHDRRA